MRPRKGRGIAEMCDIVGRVSEVGVFFVKETFVETPGVRQFGSPAAPSGQTKQSHLLALRLSLPLLAIYALSAAGGRMCLSLNPSTIPSLSPVLR